MAAKGCRVGLIRPIDAMGNYPIQPKYDRVWHAMEETGVVYGMHPFPAFGVLKPPGYTEQYSGAELIALTHRHRGLPHSFPDQRAEFPGRSVAVGRDGADVGILRALSEDQGGGVRGVSTWLSFMLDECDKAYRLYRNERNCRR